VGEPLYYVIDFTECHSVAYTIMPVGTLKYPNLCSCSLSRTLVRISHTLYCKRNLQRVMYRSAYAVRYSSKSVQITFSNKMADITHDAGCYSEKCILNTCPPTDSVHSLFLLEILHSLDDFGAFVQ
jgi:hypothetical protein